MPTPPLQPGHPEWENVEKAWHVYHVEHKEKLGAVTAAAEAVGRPRNTVNRWLTIYKTWSQQDPVIQDSMRAAGAQMAPTLVWAKTKTRKDGTTVTDYSAMFKPDPVPDELLARIRSAFEDMQPAQLVEVARSPAPDLLAVWPVMDLHFGMYAWGDETGGPGYDTARAASDLRYAVEKVLSLTPETAETVLILGGDTLHADDNLAVTPKNKHALDVDGRHYKVIDEAITSIGHLVERVASKCGKLTVRVLRGNHDENAHHILTFALAERYRGSASVYVEKEPRDLFMRQWGRAAVFAHHGDKAKPVEMALQLADVCPFWSDTRHRYALTGHVHYDQAKDVGGLRWESLRAFCPPDAYAAGMGYVARRAMQALVFDKRDGLVLRALDPIERV